MSGRLPIYCHIGIPKTGTSYLQQALTNHADELAEAGFAYPRVGFLGEKGTAQHFLSFAISEGKPDWVVGDVPALEDFRDICSRPEFEDKRLIFSSENFSSPNVAERCDKLREIFPDRDIYIIAYLRKPGDQQKSWYGQIIKDHPFAKMTFEQFASSNKFPFYEVLGRYVEEFGRDRVIVLDYDKQREQGGVAAMFCDAIALDGATLKLPDGVNVSPSGWHIELCRRLNHVGEGEIPIIVRRQLNEAMFHVDPELVLNGTGEVEWKEIACRILKEAGVEDLGPDLRSKLLDEMVRYFSQRIRKDAFDHSCLIESVNRKYDEDIRYWRNFMQGRADMESVNEPAQFDTQNKSEGLAKHFGCSAVIHAEDEIFNFAAKKMAHSAALADYMRGGSACAHQIARKMTDLNVGPVIDDGTEMARPARVLEFASGYGRVTRHLKKTIDCEVHASDIHPQACEFIEKELQVTAIVSDYEPENFKTTTNYDFVFALSLFSHLPDRLFGRWLKRLYDCLEVNGVLLVTTIGQTTLRDRAAFWADRFTPGADFTFLSQSEQGDLDAESYGTMAIMPHYFTATLRDHIPDAMLVSFSSGRWFAHQDEWVIRRVK
ncbi:class I SAM-dependent methyltransferase [Breoghania sp.]|uniref:class I SAM-dependent methyltransferase n=1 Tax=Breoghania sp. TaxID=2065378 RepID=UPI002AA7743C|nr:class I SAM-dependent methyltransferase [Breoghania sp.]